MWNLLLACSHSLLPSEPGAPTEPPATSPGTGDTAPTLDTAGDTDTLPPTDTAPPYDCSVPPAVPVQYDTLQGWGTAEDFDFDVDGFHVAVLNTNLVGHDQYGAQKIISPSIGGFTSGTRVLATGDWVVADSGAGSFVRIDLATGGQEVIAGGLNYPNGVEVSHDGYAFVAENGAGRVIQVDPYTKERWPVASGLDGANGLTFNPEEDILYVGSFGAGKVWGIPRLGPTEWDASFVLWDTILNDGGFDGINTDICGNVYLTEYTQGRVWRILPDGSKGDLVVDLPSFWIPNIRWGNGHGGWATNYLYVADRDQGRLFALHMGIEGRHHVSIP
jgi:sugar lactone lactonase YvrE